MNRKLPAIALLLCGSAWAAQPPPLAPTTSFVFSATVSLLPAQKVGNTPLGGRQFIPITGGSFAGPGIKGIVRPGGWDWQLRRADGSMVIEADYFLETDDHVIIHVHNKGIVMPGPGKSVYARTVPQFEVPIGKYGWLNDTIFVGELGAPPAGTVTPAVQITVYKVNG